MGNPCDSSHVSYHVQLAPIEQYFSESGIGSWISRCEQTDLPGIVCASNIPSKCAELNFSSFSQVVPLLLHGD